MGRVTRVDLLDPTRFDVACTFEVSDPVASLTPVVFLELFGFPGITAITASGARVEAVHPVDDGAGPVYVLALPFYLGEAFAAVSALGLGGALGR